MKPVRIVVGKDYFEKTERKFDNISMWRRVRDGVVGIFRPGTGFEPLENIAGES